MLEGRPQVAPLAVTTSGSRDEALIAHARAAAARWGLPFVERPRKAPLSALLGHRASALLAFGADGLTLWDAQGSLRFSPGMAMLRVKRLDAGRDEDLMLRFGEIAPGDAILDCTLGLGADALVAARAVGPSGRVVGVERSLALFALAEEGLGAYPYGPRSARVEVVHADSGALLKAQPAGSFDVVLCDPMFNRPRRSSPAFEMLRRYADPAPLTPEMLDEARRVARRWVLVKAAKYWNDLGRLGLTALPVSRFADVVWARLAANPRA